MADKTPEELLAEQTERAEWAIQKGVEWREKYEKLLEFVQQVAGDGYINTRGTARMYLKDVGEKPAPRDYS